MIFYTISHIASIILAIIGTIFIFKNTPENQGAYVGLCNISEAEKYDRKANKKNNRAKLGLIFILISYFILLGIQTADIWVG